MRERQTGTVKWFDDSRGFGFIQIDGQNRDIIVHHSAIEIGDGLKTLSEGERVEFTIKQGVKGRPAVSQVWSQLPLHQVDFGDEALHRMLLADMTDGILGG